MAIIRIRTNESLLHAEFENITESTLLILVKDDDLAIDETDLFDALKRWAVKECGRRDLDVTGPHLRQVKIKKTKYFTKIELN